jgi:nicotinamidase-related amidase
MESNSLGRFSFETRSLKFSNFTDDTCLGRTSSVVTGPNLDFLVTTAVMTLISRDGQDKKMFCASVLSVPVRRGARPFSTSRATQTKGLLLVDVQNDYFPGGKMELNKANVAGQNAKEVLRRLYTCLTFEVLQYFRSKNLPVVHVKHEFPPSSFGFLEKGTQGADIHPSVSPLPSEPVITKQNVNSFKDTPLEGTLKKLGVTDLVIVGAMSHMCIDGTVRAAADLGFKCVVPADACACPDVSFGGRTVSADDVHATAMGALGFAYAQVTSTKDVTKE